jgi:septum site-determining protein MinC
MEENIISFKATLNGLILVMREEDDFDVIYESVARKLETSGRFFKGASLDVKYRGKKLDSVQENKLASLMHKSQRRDKKL